MNQILNDLINDNGEFYSHEEFQEITGINSNTLQYHGTINAIKAYLKDIKINITHKMKNPLIPSHVQPFIKDPKLCMIFLTKTRIYQQATNLEQNLCIHN